MKKTTVTLASITLALSLAACGGATEAADSPDLSLIHI